jgi:hypothetical protein
MYFNTNVYEAQSIYIQLLSFQSATASLVCYYQAAYMW